MALFSRLRSNPILNQLLKHRTFSSSSSILSPNNNAPLTSKQKTRAALSLLKSETNPERIIDICRAASLTPESHLDRIAFSVAISKLSDANHFSGISTYLEDLKTRPDLQTERFLSHSIVLYGQANMIDHAIRSFQEMNRYGVSQSVKALNSLLFACVLAKDYKQVKRIFLEFPKTYSIEPDLETYNTVIKAFCESGDSSSCYSILAEMDRKSVRPNATSFGLMLAGFYKEERFEDVGKVLKLMERYGIKPGLSTYNIRILSLCKLGKCAEAKALFDGMVSRGTKPNSDSYNHLIHGFCKEGDLEEAKSLFRRMVRSGCSPNSECYFTLVYFLSKGGDYETALEVCKESMKKGWVPNFGTMKMLVNGLAGVSKVGEAKELVGQMKEKFTRNVDLWNEVEAGLPQ